MAVAEVREALAGGVYTFVYRTDIRGYYRHIRKQQVINQLKWQVADPVLFDMMQQYVHYCAEEGGEFYTPLRGIYRIDKILRHDSCETFPLCCGASTPA
ncbi:MULTISPECIES: hypothetical protein [Serratia]|uniref:hypothetical protein n=1 Tax=Serratia TaxID=613 RepID=UPI0004494F02|nr:MULTISPECIES: hypothetical protein [Serratia]EZQ72529.1 hypothetical protein AF53_01306 [Serratia marcescens BIDMC 80]KMJ06728.1 hypothetical protein SN05_00875 [Serratia marcescens]MCS1374422.1 hypothetical protein [Serratia marcescens]MDU2600706.1 hypothetical protein [Serratia marcescens]MDU2740017.1 hypothetical protein [Serratia marcescens]